MTCSLIICTYQRPKSLSNLLGSIKIQSHYPQEIIVVDGSIDNETEKLLLKKKIKNLKYFKVGKDERGLTKQRNFGVNKANLNSDLFCFLDDDTILNNKFFEEILRTYNNYPEAMGVSGFISNQVDWQKVPENFKSSKKMFVYDGWMREEGSRFQLRRKFGLTPDVPPGYMPDFSHGYSTAYLPPSGKIYEVEMLMGGVTSYRKEVFNKHKFSTYFEGYGLYEDADFSLRVSKIGKLYVNTRAKVEHHHAAAGRPNMVKYGKMVIRNGMYVWHIKNPNPSLKATFKWHATSFLLTMIRFGNSINSQNNKAAFQDGWGRVSGWFGMLLNKPAHNEE